MSTDAHNGATATVDQCPVCGTEYAHRIHKADDCFSVGRYYRHEQGAYVYLHRSDCVSGPYPYWGTEGGDQT